MSDMLTGEHIGSVLGSKDRLTRLIVSGVWESRNGGPGMIVSRVPGSFTDRIE